MCGSKPKIPENKTPVAPNAPEPGPDALVIGSEREQAARARGLVIPPKVDLSGLGNQSVGAPVSRLRIDPRSTAPVDPVARDAQDAQNAQDAEAYRAAQAQSARPRGAAGRGRRTYR